MSSRPSNAQAHRATLRSPRSGSTHHDRDRLARRVAPPLVLATGRSPAPTGSIRSRQHSTPFCYARLSVSVPTRRMLCASLLRSRWQGNRSSTAPRHPRGARYFIRCPHPIATAALRRGWSSRPVGMTVLVRQRGFFGVPSRSEQRQGSYS